MSSDVNEIKHILKKYYYFTAVISSGKADLGLVEKMAAINAALQNLDSIDRNLIEMLYMRRQSADDVAKQLFIDRSTVFRRAKAIVDDIWYCFGGKFKKGA